MRTRACLSNDRLGGKGALARTRGRCPPKWKRMKRRGREREKGVSARKRKDSVNARLDLWEVSTIIAVDGWGWGRNGNTSICAVTETRQ